MNYDITMDVALYELVYADETGADRGESDLSDVNLGSTEFRDPYTDEYALSDTKATVDLLKLHGSLNWLYCPRRAVSRPVRQPDSAFTVATPRC